MIDKFRKRSNDNVYIISSNCHKLLEVLFILLGLVWN